MDGETNGGQEATQGAQDTSQQQGQEQQETQQGQSQVGGETPDYEKQIAERDEKIASLEAQVAEAAKNAETAEQLRAEIAELKAQGESDRIDFKLQLAGVRNVKAEDLSEVTATDILQALRDVTSAMDEKQVTLGSRYLFITPTLKGVLDNFSYANPTMSNRVLERFARVIEVPQVRFYTAIDLKSGDTEFGYAKAAAGKAINFMVVEKSAVIKFDKHVASRVFSPDELESLDSYMMKYRKYGIVELFDNKLDGVYVSAATE